ncbi:MAG: DUF1134 domain-containing protein [Roseibium sp.]
MAQSSRQFFAHFWVIAACFVWLTATQSVFAQSSDGAPIAPGDTYKEDEVVKAGHRFFGSVSGGLASVVEKAFSSYGEPNGYILGEEGSGAFVAGARYGEGHLYTRNAGNHKVFWQGPSLGWDFGADGARTMILVYRLPDVSAIYERFAGVNGSAYLVGGIGMTVLLRNEVILVPIRAGLGARLGVNLGYLKLTPKPTWNPF